MGYRAYPEYKDSGVEWLGRVPADWEVRRLKFSSCLINEKVDAQDSTLEYLSLEHIESCTGKRIADDTSTSEGITSKFSPNDVLFGKLRPYLAKVWLADGHGVATTEALVIRPDNEVIGSFLKYFMLSRDFIDVVNGSTYGSKMPRANWDFIGNLSMLIPAIEEQRQIAQFLDHKTAQIDRLIEKKQELIEKLQEERVTIITQVVTRGLTPTITLKDSGVEWLGKIPRHWQCVGFTKSISSQVDYRGKTPEKVQEGVFLVTAKNIKDGTINYELSKEYVRDDQYDEIMSRGKPEIGDLLFTTEAPLGEVANIDRTDIALAQRVIKFRGEATKLDNYFARYWFMSRPFQDHLKSLATGSTALGIKASKLFELRIALPPLEEQVSIRNFLDERLQALTATEAKITEAIESLQEYRTALITAAVTGQIDVRDWQAPEPTKEPADKEVA